MKIITKLILKAEEEICEKLKVIDRDIKDFSSTIVKVCKGKLLSHKGFNKKILDACCGSRMFWFDKENPDVLFCDNRKEKFILCDDRKLNINPNMKIDFREMPFDNNSFKLVVFDPPHLNQLGENSWMAKKYGKLNSTWRTDIKKGFLECMRVLEVNGILIFKWNETQIKVSEIIKLIDTQPLFGHKSGKLSKTHWLCFMKR